MICRNQFHELDHRDGQSVRVSWPPGLLDPVFLETPDKIAGNNVGIVGTIVTFQVSPNTSILGLLCHSR